MRIKKIFFLSLVCFQYGYGSADEVVQNIRKIEIAQKIYPCLLDKDQLFSLLSVLKQCHLKVSQTEQEERSKLQKIEKEIEKAAEEVTIKGQIPDPKVSDKIKKLLEECKNKRNAIIMQNIQEVNKVLLEKLKPWQKKSLGLSESNLKDFSDLIRYTFLDLLCYEILFSNLKKRDPKRAESLK